MDTKTLLSYDGYYNFTSGPCWEHVDILIDPEVELSSVDTCLVHCKYCSLEFKVSSETRIRQQLLGPRSVNEKTVIAICLGIPRGQIIRLMNKNVTPKSPALRKRLFVESNAAAPPSGTLDAFVKPRESIETIEADSDVARWFYHANISFNSITSQLFVPMIKAICNAGCDYRGPSLNALRNKVLDQEYQIARKYFSSLCSTLPCTLTADSYTSNGGNALLRFTICEDVRSITIDTIHTPYQRMTGEYVKEKMLNTITEARLRVGLIVTDQGTNMEFAGKNIELESPKVTYSPCVAHLISNYFIDLTQLRFVKDVVDDALSIASFIKNHQDIHDLFMKEKGIRI
ncbi:hypothetical protein RCL1_008233 [Eukaryota sp. TZLM3-RCL]